MIGLTDSPLDVAGCIADVTDPACGAVASFVGIVRRSPSGAPDGSVQALEYEAHEPLAAARLEEIAAEARARWELHAVALVHRTGRCALGEPTVVVACGAPHRAEALEACRWIIDTVKATVPVWKKEIYEDGSMWVGAGS